MEVSQLAAVRLRLVAAFAVDSAAGPDAASASAVLAFELASKVTSPEASATPCFFA